MTVKQRRVLLILGLISLVYFAAFAFPNSYGARSQAILLDASSDEYVVYPNVERMLTLGKTFNEERANLFLYEDYHYGYPFFALSALTLLPVRLVYGADFTRHLQLNLLLLRQFISLLPMILAAGLLVYLQTRFQSLLKSIALFVFLLTIRGVVRNHIWWWHPDALAVLCVVLTLFFLDRDHLRLGRNFYLAALFCGSAVAIKLLGEFFVLTIPLYLLAAWMKNHASLSRAALAGTLFVIVMVAITVFSNPFLFSKDQRARMLMIQQTKQVELSQGYSHDDAVYYSKGPQWWASTLEKWYGSPLFLALLFGSLIAGCLWGPHTFINRLILTWVVPYSIYLLYFVAVKPDHYWLPVMLPLFSSAFAVWDILAERVGLPTRALFSRAVFSRDCIWEKVGMAAVALVLAGTLVINLARPVSGNIAIYQSALQRGVTQIQTIH